MTVALSSLRVTADMDSSAYTQGMAAKVAADQAGAASSDAVGAALARQDAALDKAVPGVSRLSKSLLDGYGAASTFERTVRSIGDAMDRGMGLDRANLLLDAAYRKFGLVADAAVLAQQGYVSLAPSIDALNQHYSIQSEILDRATQAQVRNTQAQEAQWRINSQLSGQGVGGGVLSPSASASGAPSSAQNSALNDMMKQQEKAADSLKAKLDPLTAAQAKLDAELANYSRLAQLGLISSGELTAAQAMAQKQFADTTDGMSKFGAASIFGSTQGMALTAALRHMFDAIMAGRPPLQALSMEIGNLEYGLSGLGSMGETLKGIGTWIGALLTPLNILIAIVVAVGAAAIAAATSWHAAQLEIATALTGIGKAAGATVDDINQIAEAHSSISTISISEARNVAIALAETGKVSKETFGPIIDLTKNFAVTMGTSVKDAAKTLATAFTDPVKGADDLNKRLGFLDDATRKLIESLQAQGDRQGANAVLTEALSGSVGKATDLTSGWAKAWNLVSNAVSSTFTRIGEFVSNEGPSLDAQIDSMTKKLKDLQAQQEGRGSGAVGQKLTPMAQSIRSGFAASDNAAIDETTAALKRLTDQKTKVFTDQQEAQARQFSLQIQGIITEAVPAGEELRKMSDSAEGLIKVLGDPVYAKYLLEIDETGLALERWTHAAETLLDPTDKQTKLLQLQVEAMDHRSIADKTAIATQQKLLELSGQKNVSDEEAAKIAGLAGQIAGGGSTASDARRSADISALGSAATMNQKIEDFQIKINNLKREGTTLTDTELQKMKATAIQQEEGFRLQEKIQVGVASEEEIRKVMDNEMVAFISRRRTLALSQADDSAYVAYQEKRIEKMIEQSKIAGSQLEGLKKVELDSGNFRLQVDTTAVSGINQMTTSIVDFTTGSKNATTAFQDFATSLIKMLEEMLVKMLIVLPVAKALQAALGPMVGGVTGGPSPVSNPYAGMAAGTNPTFHSGGMMNEPSGSRYVNPSVFANAPRFHSGIGPDEVAAVLKRNEGVFTPGQMAAMAPAGRGGGNTQVNVYNQADNTTVKTSKRRSGGVDATDVIISTVGKHMANGGFDAQLRARTNTQLQPRPR